VIVCPVAFLGGCDVKDTEQLADAPLSEVSVHVAGLKLPRPLLEKLTVPVGVLVGALSMSVTVAMHCQVELTVVQLTLVDVVRPVTVTVAVPLLARCAESPP
jgi:hypothetical protein